MPHVVVAEFARLFASKAFAGSGDGASNPFSAFINLLTPTAQPPPFKSKLPQPSSGTGFKLNFGAEQTKNDEMLSFAELDDDNAQSKFVRKLVAGAQLTVADFLPPGTPLGSASLLTPPQFLKRPGS